MDTPGRRRRWSRPRPAAAHPSILQTKFSARPCVPPIQSVDLRPGILEQLAKSRRLGLDVFGESRRRAAYRLDTQARIAFLDVSEPVYAHDQRIELDDEVRRHTMRRQYAPPVVQCVAGHARLCDCLLYTSPSPRDS